MIFSSENCFAFEEVARENLKGISVGADSDLIFSLRKLTFAVLFFNSSVLLIGVKPFRDPNRISEVFSRAPLS